MFKVVINNRDRLSTTKKLVEDLLERNTQEIWIIDNASTYLPLLEWYHHVPEQVRVLRHHNAGHLALWSLGVINNVSEEWVFYTDSDIELNPGMPKDYQSVMLEAALHYGYNKVGLALDLNDIPEHYWLRDQVLRNEGRWWATPLAENVYVADTDTTFNLNRKVDQYSSIRLAGDFTCKHVPWYVDINNLDPEEQYYYDHYDAGFNTQYTKQHKEKREM
jgi:glycosyltransferase involved in cell wall biosynthesis